MATPGQPFYYQITQTQETFKDSGGISKTIDLPLITLPPGTVLFRGMKVPNPAEVDARVFYRDYLGDPEGSRQVCMRPTQNVFFYPFPYVAFGANEVGQNFDMMQMVVLVHPVNVVCSISPSEWVRGMGQRYDGDAPYRRCDSFPLSCHPLTQEERVGLSYDNCLSPEYQVRSGTRGWMALADLDSFNPTQEKVPYGMPKPVGAPSSMKLYLKALEARKPGAGAELAAWSYTDRHRHHGFPEISLYPYKTHQGNRLLKRGCPDADAAIRLMEKEAAADNLNFLPLATFTRNGTIDMVNGLFTVDALGISANSFSTPAADKQPVIEQKIGEYMDLLQTRGLKLPFFGPGKLCLDTRTGFYMFPQVVPRNLVIPLPAEAAPASVGGGGSAPQGQAQTTQPYRFLALPLDTPEAKKRALNYILIFRNAVPAKFMEKYGLDKGFGIRRAMVFDRPPVLPRVFQELDLEVPKDFKAGIARAAALFQKNTGAPRKTGAKQTEAEAVPTFSLHPYGAYGMPVGAAGASTTPPFGGTPPYGAGTPPYGAGTPPYGAGTPPYGAGTPPYGAGTPQFGPGGKTPEFGGTPQFGANAPKGPGPVGGAGSAAAAAAPSKKDQAIANIRSGKITFEELRGNPTYNLSEKNFRAIAGMHKELGFSPPFLAEEENKAPPYLAIGGTRRKAKKAKKGTRSLKGKKSLENLAKLFSKVWKGIKA